LPLFLVKFAQWKQCSAILRVDILLLVDVDVAMVKANSQVVTRGRKWVIWATKTGDFSSRFKGGRLPPTITFQHEPSMSMIEGPSDGT
jgi:hypothetical protein